MKKFALRKGSIETAFTIKGNMSDANATLES